MVLATQVLVVVERLLRAAVRRSHTTMSTAIDDRANAARRTVRALVPIRHRPAIAGAIRSFRYRGASVHCPCCDGDFSRFIPHRGRPYAKCPRCGALERHRLLLLFLRERTDIFSGDLAMLHVAPEHALQQRLRRLGNLRYLSVDLDSPLAMEHADLLDLPYAEARFDLVMCNHVLEHVDDDRKALREITRVLRPGGQAVIMSPIDEDRTETLEDERVISPEERHRVFGQSDHLRRYGRDFAERVATEGFAVSKVSYLEQIDPDTTNRLGLRRDSDLFQQDEIFICVKR
jgi:SAM-dependent methyltransferase